MANSFLKNLAFVISYLSSDSLSYSKLYENFRSKPQDFIQTNRRKQHILKYTVTSDSVTQFNSVIILNYLSHLNKAAITSSFGSEFLSAGIREILFVQLFIWQFLLRTLESSRGKGPHVSCGNKLFRCVSPHFSKISHIYVVKRVVLSNEIQLPLSVLVCLWLMTLNSSSGIRNKMSCFRPRSSETSCGDSRGVPGLFN